MVKCGLEIHQQLATKKLFCDCDSELSDEVLYRFERVLRPTQSELGEIDRAALEESLKHRRFIYEVTPNSCLVEADEEPPHELNREALEIALKIALMLNAQILDEIHVM
ncbi:MAG: Glu-tRNA(Gln) amidotransferase GatDE subunit E, partial [Thermoplasmata archaeon]|nr:Glu-tRNA(Gln) amidotransferase GatDE subunit E [Thermoplasmata archaeon]